MLVSAARMNDVGKAGNELYCARYATALLALAEDAASTAGVA